MHSPQLALFGFAPLPRRRGRLSEEVTSSAHIRSQVLSTALVGAPMLRISAILTDLEALTSGTRIAIPSIVRNSLDSARA